MMLHICWDKSCNHFSVRGCFTAGEPNQTPLISSSTSSLFDFNEITSEVPELGFSLNYHCVCMSFGGRCARKGCVKLTGICVLLQAGFG